MPRKTNPLLPTTPVRGGEGQVRTSDGITPDTEEASEALLLLGGSFSDSAVTPQGQGIPRLTPRKPDAKRKLDLEPKKTRIDSSLSALTRRFVTLIPNGGSLDLNAAARSLQVQKRRIYDITNVLEGIGVLTKKSKNNIQWSDKLSTLEGDKRKKKLESELAYLAKKEDEVDNWISSLETSMKSMTEEKRWAYLTHADIRTIPMYKDQTLLLVKAPPNTSLTVPPPEEGLQMHMKSEGGEIGVYLCPEEEDATDSTSNTSTPVKAASPMDESPMKMEMSPPPIITNMSTLDSSFYPLELMPDIEYNFTLGVDEGLADLFDKH